MSGIRAYVNPYPPRYSETWQRARLSPEATIYVQQHGGEQRKKLIQSLRKGEILEVVPLFVFAKLTGGTKRRTADLLKAIDEALSRGVIIREGKDGRSSRKGWNAALIEAREMIGSSARGIATGAKNGRASKGRPRKQYTEQVEHIIDRFWPPRKGWTVDRSVEAINDLSAPVTVKRGWLYTNRPIRTESK